MDSSDIYYSDNSQLIDENNSEWMRNTVLIENESLTWQEDGPEITVDYTESSPNINKTLSENDEYLTVENDDNTETSQYFSILEPNCDDDDDDDDDNNDVDDDEFTKSESNSICYIKYTTDAKEEVIVPDVVKRETDEDKSENEEIDSEVDKVLLYRMEGSEDLFAIQLADDGNGNYQKYKYKVRQGENGQLEAIPGSVEIQKVDENNDELEDPECKEQKPNQETLSLINQQINEDETEMGNNFYINSVDNFENISSAEYLLQNTSYEDNDYQTIEHVNMIDECESQNETIVKTDIEKDNSESEYEIEELEEAFQDENINDTYNLGYDNPQILQHKTNLDNLKVKSSEYEKEYKQHLADNRNVTIYKDDKHLSYLVVKTKEKENVSLTQPALRSILKSSYTNNKTKTTQKTVDKQTLPAIILNKDFKSTKDTSQVSHPVVLKSARQPRKQIITPVERAGSEIIVQQLVYPLTNDTSDEFLVPVKRKRIIEEILQVSDESDPEFTLKPMKKKKIKRNKQGRRGRPRNMEITILDSDEEEEQQSDDSIIEVLTDQEDESDNNNEQFESEQERTQNIVKDKEKENSNEKVREQKTNEDNEEKSEKKEMKSITKENNEKSVKKVLGNKKNKCPYCPKTFPRLINLKKHLNIHSTRKSLRLKTNKPESEENTEKEKQETDNQELDKQVNDLRQKFQFSCTKCKLKFLTESQFKRHQTVHMSKIRKSPINISDKHILRSQSRTRNKQISSAIRKTVAVNNKTKEIFKCEYCGQICSSRSLLIIHRNSHKTFPCPNCKTTFTAKLLLDDHLRKNCVKFSPKKPRFKKSSPKKQIIKCETCAKVFQSEKSLQVHKNISHKLENSKEIMEGFKKDLMKKKIAHGGVPVSAKMQQALRKLKVKS